MIYKQNAYPVLASNPATNEHLHFAFSVKFLSVGLFLGLVFAYESFFSGV